MNMLESIQFTEQTFERFCQQAANFIYPEYDLTRYGDFRSYPENQSIDKARFSIFPFYLTEADQALLDEVSVNLTRILSKVISAVQQGSIDKEFVPKQFHKFLPYFKKVNNKWLTKARYDFLIDTNGEIKFTEFNTSAPGGSIFWTAVQEILNNTDCRQTLEESKAFVRYFVNEVQAFLGSDSYIAFLYDCHNVRFELYEMQKQVESLGFNALVVDAIDLIYHDGALYYDDKKISVVYNNFFLSGESCDFSAAGLWQSAADLVSAEHPYHDLFQAVLNNQCLLFITVPAMTLVEDKSIFATLYSLIDQEFFNKDESEFIKRHIPYTAALTKDSLEKNKTDYLSEKDQLVIKVNHSALGKGVFLGKDSSEEEWLELLESQVGSATIQSFISSYRFPGVDTDTQQASRFYATFSIYNWSGNYVGCLARQSREVITNYSAGQVYPIVRTSV